MEGDRYDRVGAVLSIRASAYSSRLGRGALGLSSERPNQKHRMTLCGSEVPQDRWRGRTAGSGMWTRTENLLSWSPSGDSAIPYG